jgi:hypothetical protein
MVVARGMGPPRLPVVPEERYRMPAWSEAKVKRDFRVRAQHAFYPPGEEGAGRLRGPVPTAASPSSGPAPRR